MVISVVKLHVHKIISINYICLRNSWRHCIWAIQFLYIEDVDSGLLLISGRLLYIGAWRDYSEMDAIFK